MLDFDNALERLDQERYTLISIHGAGDAHLAIGGGANRYVVYATFDNEVFWNLLSIEPSSGIVLLNAGGQPGDYPAKQVVDLEQARAAGRVFLESHQLDPSQEWLQQ